MFIRESDLRQKPTAHGDKIPVRKRVIMPKGVIGTITQIATSVSIGPCNTADVKHIHPDMWEVYFVREGRAEFTVGKEVYEAIAGDTIAVPPKTIHHYKVQTGETLELFYFGVETND